MRSKAVMSSNSDIATMMTMMMMMLEMIMATGNLIRANRSLLRYCLVNAILDAPKVLPNDNLIFVEKYNIPTEVGSKEKVNKRQSTIERIIEEKRR